MVLGQRQGLEPGLDGEVVESRVDEVFLSIVAGGHDERVGWGGVVEGDVVAEAFGQEALHQLVGGADALLALLLPEVVEQLCDVLLRGAHRGERQEACHEDNDHIVSHS